VIVAGPGLLIVGSRLRNAYFDNAIRQDAIGRGYFSGRAMKEAGQAVVLRDAAGLEKLLPEIDVNREGSRGMTLVRLAVERAEAGQFDPQGQRTALAVLRALLENGAKANPGMEAATKVKDQEILRALLEAGADANLKANGEAVVFPWINVLPAKNLRLLAKHGADINSKDRHGTPLILRAAQGDNWEVVAVLLELGADREQADRQGLTLRSLVADRVRHYRQESAMPEGMGRVRAMLETQPGTSPEVH
jgi:hypothetical protein